MLVRENMIFAWLLLLIQLCFQFYPCLAMDLVEQEENKLKVSSINRKASDSFSKDDVAIWIEEPVSLSVKVDNARDPLKNQIDNLLSCLYSSPESSKQIIPKDDTAFETALVSYRNWRAPSQSAFNWDDQITFLDTFDELFFICPRSKKTKVLQFLASSTCALAPWAMGPLAMYLSEDILGFLPVAGPAAYGVIFTVIACSTPPCAQQGCEFGGQVGNFLFDKNGFLPTKSDKKPHIQPASHPIISRASALFGATLRTVPFILLFREAEEYHLGYFYGFVGSFAASLFKRTYDYNMGFWNRFSHAHATAEDHMLGEKKKVLLGSVKKMRTLLNFKDKKSDDLVELLYGEIREELKRVKLFHNLKNHLETKDKTALVNTCFDFMKDKLQGIECGEELKNELGELIERKECVDRQELDEEERGENGVKNSFHFAKDKPLVNILYSYLLNKIKEIKLKYSLKKYIVPYNEEFLIKTVYTYIQQQKGVILRNDSLKKEIEKRVKEYFKPNALNDPQSFIQEIYSYIEEQVQGHPLSTDPSAHIALSESEKSISVFSLLFLKSMKSKAFQFPMEQLIETTKKIIPNKTQNAEEATELLDAVRNVTSIQVQEMSNLISDIDKIPSQSLGKRLLENSAILLQGMATPGRFLISQWAIETTFTYMGVDPNVSFYLGVGTAGVDVLYRIVQEWYLQKETFSKLRKFGSQTNDFWPLRWVANSLSAFNSAFYTLPTVAIIFDVLDKQSIYTKILLSAMASPSEGAAFFHFLQEKWSHVISNISTLSKQYIKTVQQKRAWLNNHLDRAAALIPQLDKETTDALYTLNQEGL